MDLEQRNRINNGIWYTIHMLSAKAITPERKAVFREYMKFLSEDNLPCSNCSYHLREYLMQNPLEKELNYFVWSWRFHNTVNQRLGKPEVDFETASKLYLHGGAVCRQCGIDNPSADNGDRGTTVFSIMKY